MKQEQKLALGIAGIVVLAGIAGAVIFLTTGSTLGVAFVLVGIPAVLIVAGVLHVKGVVTRTGTTASEFKKQRLRTVGDQVRDLVESYDRLRAAHPSFDATHVDNELSQLLARLREQGVAFDRESTTYSVQSPAAADVGELDRIESDVQSLDETIGETVNEYVRSEIDRLDHRLGALVEAGLVASYESPTRPADDETDPDALVAALDDARGTAGDVVDDARDELEALTADASDEAAVDRHLTDASTARENGDYATAVDELLAARRTLSEDLEGDFEGKRQELAQVFETVADSDADRHVARERLQPVDELEGEFQSADDALDIGTLRRIESDLRDACTAIVDDLETDLAENVRTLEQADIPDSFYERPDCADQEYVAALEDATALEAFRRTWAMAVDELTAALDDTDGRVTAVESYPNVEDAIDEAFTDGGPVTAGDLPVKRAEPFMDLYAATHPAVAFDRAGTRLLRGDPEETHAVTVVASFAEPGDEREATVAIEGPGHSASAPITTYLADEVVFDDVPPGEYTVRADPAADGFRTASVDCTVDDDTEVSVTMDEIGLREQVCAGNEDTIREILPDVEGELETRFDGDGHLTSTDDYPVKADYVPCLLALWAEDEGYEVALDDREAVVVYDGDELTTELTSVLRYNVDPGDDITYGEVRERFLSAPVPDDVIRKAVEASDVERTVEAGETSIHVEDTE